MGGVSFYKIHSGWIMNNIKQRWIHIDLSGVAPTVNALAASIERLTSWGINGFLVEFTDMFPHEVVRQSIRRDCYTQDEWRKIFDACRKNKAKFVPLIQTAGHLEWFLWHKDFAHLKAGESEKGIFKKFEQLKPGLKEGIDLIITMIDEVIDLHGDLKFFHIGGDELHYGKDTDYLRHMLPIMEHIISRGISPIIWSDNVLKHHEIISKLPEQVIIADWHYHEREQISTVITYGPYIWGEGWIPFGDLSARNKKEFGQHLYRGLEYGGQMRRVYPYPSYLKSRAKPFFVVPSAQCDGDAFTHPSLYWRFDNIRSFCREGYENETMGAINSDWIEERIMRELTRLCHYGFAKTALQPDIPPSNKEIIQGYWEEISPGAGKKAFEIFDRIAEKRGTYCVARYLSHNLDSTGRHMVSFKEIAKQIYKSGDQTADRIQENMVLAESGKAITEFCAAIIPGLEGEKQAEVQSWRLAGLDISFRARLRLLIMAKQQGEDRRKKSKALINEAEKLEKEFRKAWKGRYLESDIEAEMAWRFRDVIWFLTNME